MKTEGSKLAGLVVTAIGVVFGDIGTSPLYAVRETFAGQHALPVTAQNVYGVLSVDLLGARHRRDAQVHHAHHARRQPRRGRHPRADGAGRRAACRGEPRAGRCSLLLGIFGAAMFYGDGMITPAISVLGAVEGLEIGDAAARALRRAR